MQGGGHTTRAQRTLFFRPTPAPAAKFAKGRRAPAPPGLRLRGRRLTSSVAIAAEDGAGDGRWPRVMPMAPAASKFMLRASSPALWRSSGASQSRIADPQPAGDPQASARPPCPLGAVGGGAAGALLLASTALLPVNRSLVNLHTV